MALSIIKERHERVPCREHDEQKRKRDVDKEPTMQPMLHLSLQIEHAPLVAPRLDFIHAHTVSLGDAQPDESERVFRKARVANPISFAALGREIRNYLSIQEFEQRHFGIWIVRRGRGHDWFWRDRCD